MRRILRWLRDERGVGWTFDSGVVALGVWDNGNAEAPLVKALEPTIPAGQAPWLWLFVRQLIRSLTVLAKNFGNIANIRLQANNSTGDANGVGTLTITITTS